MVRFGLVQNTALETILKTVTYRLYATLVTISISYFIFGIQSAVLVLSFATADIISGILTYLTFENIWIWLHGFKPILVI
jgi:hypothetical protein